MNKRSNSLVTFGVGLTLTIVVTAPMAVEKVSVDASPGKEMECVASPPSAQIDNLFLTCKSICKTVYKEGRGLTSTEDIMRWYKNPGWDPIAQDLHAMYNGQRELAGDYQTETPCQAAITMTKVREDLRKATL